jgi:acetoacetate decarboxylase
MGVELDKKRPGHAVALFADYQFTAQNDEYLDPPDIKVAAFAFFLMRCGRGRK